MPGKPSSKAKRPRGRPEASIRPARLADVPALVELENRSFTGDWVSARSFKSLLRQGHAALLVEEAEGQIRGYALLFFRRGSRLARLYSFAVAPEHRGRGLARALLAAAEEAAMKHGAAAMRLEVRADNKDAQALYERLGYRHFGRHSAYYDDGMAALRLEKPLAPPERRRRRRDSP